ncbi:MAG: DUF4832 domain-containing protein [Armatimonadota bacterium]
MTHAAPAVSVALFAIAFGAFLLAGEGAEAQATVVVEPQEIDDILVNPGRGWTTFHRFNEDHSPDEYPPSSIAYFRWYWDVLEPEEGRYDFELVDATIEGARENGQKLAFRIMTCNGEPKVPQWYRDSGAPGNEFNDGKSWQPDYSAPIYLEKQAALIEAFGERYDGHPGIDHVDIGSMGRWGEWHTSQTGVEPPSFEVQKRIVDMYLQAFQQTPLVMLIAQRDALAYAVEHGAGWRADCLGDMREGWCHMDWYPQQLAAAGVEEAWKTARVVFETCWTMQHWKDQGWDVEEIFRRALEMHPSAVNNKSSAVPAEWWPQVREFTKKMGYRLVLRRLEHPATVAAGAPMGLSMRWENVGVAPCYDRYPLALELRGDDGQGHRVATDVDLRQWLPGTHDVAAEVELPGDLPAGEYALRLAFVDPNTDEPALKLAIAGRDDDGWYALSRVTVAE